MPGFPLKGGLGDWWRAPPTTFRFMKSPTKVLALMRSPPSPLRFLCLIFFKITFSSKLFLRREELIQSFGNIFLALQFKIAPGYKLATWVNTMKHNWKGLLPVSSFLQDVLNLELKNHTHVKKVEHTTEFLFDIC